MPIICFFVLYHKYDIYIASLGIAISSLVQITLGFLFCKEIINKNNMIIAGFAIIFGGITYLVQDAFFIKIKVSVINLIMGVIFISSYIIKKPVFQYIFKETITLKKESYRTLSLAWGVFFMLCAIANYYVAFYMSEESWVNFKIFGLLVMNIIMTIITFAYIYKKDKEERKNL